MMVLSRIDMLDERLLNRPIRCANAGVALKFNVINENVNDKRVVVIDDSIVRGNTTGPLIKLLRNAGAKEVHMAITCPPIAHPCFMGVDMGRHEDLIAYQRQWMRSVNWWERIACIIYL